MQAPIRGDLSLPSEPKQVFQGPVNLLSVIDTNTNPLCCKYTEDMQHVASGFSEGTIRLFDCGTGDCAYTLIDDEIQSYPGPVTGITHRPVSKMYPITDQLLASYVNGCIKCWNYKKSECAYTIREKRQTLGLCYHPQYPKFITYGDDCILNLYDEETQRQERAFASSQKKDIMDGHTSRVFACAVNPKSLHEMASGGWDNTVMCWDSRQPNATRYFFGVHMCGDGLDFDKSGRNILTCSWQEGENIQLWDYGSCKLIESIVPDNYNSKLYCGKLVPESNLLVCGGSDNNMLRVVDVKMKLTECSIRNMAGGVYSIDFSTVRVRRKSMLRDVHAVPRLAFVTGQRLQIVDFG